MNTEEHFRKLESMYHAARCNKYYSPHLTVGNGTSKLVIPLKPDFFHAANAVHGSVYFKALDDAAYFSVNSLITDRIVLTIEFNIQLRRPVSKGDIMAVGKVLSVTNDKYVASSELYNDSNKLIAKGHGIFVKGSTLLSPQLGYK